MPISARAMPVPPFLRPSAVAALVGGRVSIPLFERIMYYILVPDLVARIVFELGAGIYWYTLVQPKQWVFYCIMMAEYLHQSRTALKARYVRSPNLLASFLFFVLFAHGLVVGLAWHNPIGKVITDSVPMLVVALNVLLLCRTDAFAGLNVDRLVLVARVYGVVMVVAGFLAVSMGKPSIVTLGGAAGTPMCLSILLVGMMRRPRVSLVDMLILAVIVVPIVPNLTRTTLMAFLLGFGVIVVPKILRSSWSTYFAGVTVMAAIIAFPVLVPEDSPLMKRVVGTLEMSEEAGSDQGSIGERAAEVRAIEEELTWRGPNAHMFGRGAGGTYRVEFTGGQVKENYSHAHFSWALYKLRYGYVGYFYLFLFTVLLMGNILRTARSPCPENRIAFLLGVWGLIFIFTYMFYNQLVAGLQFCDNRTARGEG